MLAVLLFHVDGRLKGLHQSMLDNSEAIMVRAEA